MACTIMNSMGLHTLHTLWLVNDVALGSMHLWGMSIVHRCIHIHGCILGLLLIII